MGYRGSVPLASPQPAVIAPSWPCPSPVRLPVPRPVPQPRAPRPSACVPCAQHRAPSLTARVPGAVPSLTCYVPNLASQPQRPRPGRTCHVSNLASHTAALCPPSPPRVPRPRLRARPPPPVPSPVPPRVPTSHPQRRVAARPAPPRPAPLPPARRRAAPEAAAGGWRSGGGTMSSGAAEREGPAEPGLPEEEVAGRGGGARRGWAGSRGGSGAAPTRVRGVPSAWAWGSGRGGKRWKLLGGGRGGPELGAPRRKGFGTPLGRRALGRTRGAGTSPRPPGAEVAARSPVGWHGGRARSLAGDGRREPGRRPRSAPGGTAPSAPRGRCPPPPGRRALSLSARAHGRVAVTPRAGGRGGGSRAAHRWWNIKASRGRGR